MSTEEIIALSVIIPALIFFIGLGFWSNYKFNKSQKQSEDWRERARQAGLPYEYWRHYD